MTEMTRLIRTVLRYTSADTMDEFEKLAAYGSEIMEEVMFALTNDICDCVCLHDYAEWGTQKSVVTDQMFGEMNPLLYAIIASIFPESKFEIGRYSGVSLNS